MSAWISSATAPPLHGQVPVLAQLGEPGAAVERDPAHELRRGEVLGVAAHLPDAAVGLAPVGDRGVDLLLEERPHALRQRVARLGVQVDGVEHRAPHVVLVLVMGAVADPHRPRVLVAAEVVEDLLGQLGAAVDPVHDLELALRGLGAVGHEVEEVVGLPVEPERVEPPEREGGVADPGVAVVPVALAARRLGQRRRGGRDDRAGRRVGEALERERAALEVRAPGMVGELPAVEPVLPVVGGPDELAVGLLERARCRMLAPRQRAEDLLALLDQVPGGRARPLDAEVEVARQVQLEAAALDRHLSVVVAGVLPAAALAAVVERRLADERELDLAVHAAHRAQEHVVGVVVGRRAAVRVRAVLVVVPGTHEQEVADDDPAAAGPPGRLEDHRAGQVAPRGGDVHAGRAEPEHAGVAVEDRAEDARRVHPRQAHPLDAAGRGDERRRLAVRQEAVVGDRGEGTPSEALRRQLLDHPVVSQQRECTGVNGPAVAIGNIRARPVVLA